MIFSRLCVFTMILIFNGCGTREQTPLKVSQAVPSPHSHRFDMEAAIGNLKITSDLVLDDFLEFTKPVWPLFEILELPLEMFGSFIPKK